MVYILVAQHGKLKLINRAMIVKTLHDYMQHVEQQSHGRTTNAKTAATHLTTFKNRASLVQSRENVVRRLYERSCVALR